MRSLLQQLENNEAVLLMYLAEELPAEDRAEVEQQLTVDGTMRAELEALRGAENVMTLAMSQADGVAMPAVTEGARRSAAVRRVSRAMVRMRLEAEHAVRAPEVQPTVRTLRLPAWTYPFAAAAMIIVGWVAYWGLSSSSGDDAKRVARELPAFPQIEESDDSGSPLVMGEDPLRRGGAGYPSLVVEEGDRNFLAISAGSYDVSALFQPDRE